MSNESTEMRKFPGGATRSDDPSRLDFEGFLSPLVLRRYAQYLNKHREQADGEVRESDNWQKGIPREEYMKSATRHFIDMWAGHRNAWDVNIEESCCALLFNVMGYLFQTLLEDVPKDASFKEGDLVKVDPTKMSSGSLLARACRKCKNTGVYQRKGKNLHQVKMGGQIFRLHDYEISLREDN